MKENNKYKPVLLAWVTRAGLVLFALLAGVVLLVAVLLAVFDETDYQRVLVWSADYFLDSELHVSGPLSVRYSQGVSLAADAISLHAHDGSFSLETNAFRLHFRPVSLFTGAHRVDELVLGDLVLKINETEGGGGVAGFAIPSELIASLQINSLVVEYQEAAPGTLHRFTLDNLFIDDVNPDGSVEVRAGGVFEEQAFRLVGLLPPLDTMQDTVKPKPIRLEFASEKINITLKGTFTDLLAGEGLDLDVQADVERLEEFFEIFGNDIPALGNLEVTALLRGDLAAPRLEDIDLRLQRGGRTDLTVSGDVANVITGEGARLRVSAQTDNLALLSWLLFRQQERLSSISLKAVLEKRDSRYFISDLDVDALTPEGLNLLLGGSGEIFTKGHEFNRRDAGFSVKIRAPKTSGFYMTGRRKFPDIGGVTGSAVMALGLDAVGLHDIDISIGNRQGTHLSVLGDVGYIPLVGGKEIRKSALRLKTSTMDLARLGRQFRHQWPDLGRAALSGDIGIKGSELRLENARFSAGHPDRPIIKAGGSLVTELNKGSSLDFDFDVALADLVAAVSDIKPAYLGYVHGKTRISDMDGSWGIDKISLVSSKTSIHQLDISGSYDDLAHFDQGNIKIALAVDDMPALGKALGMKLPESGSFRTGGTLLASGGKFSYQGNTHLGRSYGTTGLDGVLRHGKLQLSGKFELPVLYLADVGLGREAVKKTGKAAGPARDDNQIFSRVPLRTAFLNSLDLELDLIVDEVAGRAMRIDSVDGHVSIKDGRLVVAPLHLNFEGGRSEIVFNLRDAAIPEYRVRIISNEVKLDSLLARLESDVPIRGSSSLHAEVTARGHSLHQLASSLNGTISLGLENARIPKKYVTFLSADVLGWVGSKSLVQDSYADLNCVRMSFDSSDGMITSTAIIADGPALSLGGRINLDLEKETLDIVLLPKQKKRVFSQISPVKISGPMKNPRVDAIPVKAAVAEIGTMALLPGVAISVKVLEKFWGFFDKEDEFGMGCAKLEELSRAAEKEPGKKVQ